MEKKDEVKTDRKGFWALLRESMNKASSGCGPGCGCHIEKTDGKNQQKSTSDNLGHGKGRE